MKAINNVCRFAAMFFGLASLILFFTSFATIVTNGTEASFVAAQLAFGSKVEIADVTYDMAKSADILLCFWLTVAAFLSSIFAFKTKKLRYATSGISIVAAVYMLVIAISDPTNFIDKRPLENVTEIAYTPFVWILAVALIVFTLISIAYLLIDDYLEVLASNGEKLTIPKRIVRFFRDYKSEVKKIVWPGYKDVIKNTIIVLIMCLLVGILIWAVDFGLGQLLNLILGI